MKTKTSMTESLDLEKNPVSASLTQSWVTNMSVISKRITFGGRSLNIKINKKLYGCLKGEIQHVINNKPLFRANISIATATFIQETSLRVRSKATELCNTRTIPHMRVI